MRQLAWIALLSVMLPAAQAQESAQEPLVAADAFHAPDRQLEELIGVLLEENPEILSARAQSRSSLERVPQRKSLPDPLLRYRYYVQTPETRVGPQQHGLELSQSVPWFGKRDLEAERAAHEAAAVAWRVQGLARSLVAELKRSYFEAGYLQEALAVNAEQADSLRRFEQIALTRYSTGEGNQQSVIQVQTDISRLADRRSALRHRLHSVTHSMTRLLGRPEARLTLDPISLDLEGVHYQWRTLEQESVYFHPAVRALQKGIEADGVWLRRRQLDRRPDFRFELGYVFVDERDDPAAAISPPQDDGQDIWSVGVAISLPIHRKRTRAGVAEAQERLHSDEYALLTAQNHLRHAIHESILRLESIKDRARLYEEVIIPQAEKSLASAETAYTTNRQDFLGLLDVESVLFEVRLSYHRLLADYWVALADLEHGLGRRFPAEGDEG